MAIFGRTNNILIFLIILSSCVVSCMTGQIHDYRATQATQAASFDSDCPSMQLVERIDNERFKLQGCGKTVVYYCKNVHQPWEYGRPPSSAMTEMMVMGTDTIEAECTPISTSYDAQAYRSSDGQSSNPPTAQRLSSLTREDIQKVMTGAKNYAQQRCFQEGKGGTVVLSIEIANDGHVSKVLLDGKTTAKSPVTECVSYIVKNVRFPAFSSNSLKVSYPIKVDRPPEIIAPVAAQAPAPNSGASSTAMPSEGDTKSQSGWRNTEWGMNSYQIIQLYPKGWRKDDDYAVVDEIAGEKATIAFHFEVDKLASAEVIFATEYDNPDQYVESYERMLDLLKTKYGEPIESEPRWTKTRYQKDKRQWGTALVKGHLELVATFEDDSTGIVLSCKAEKSEVSVRIVYSSKAIAEQKIKESKREILKDL